MEPKSIDRYPVFHQVLALRLFRPHPGMDFDKEEDEVLLQDEKHQSTKEQLESGTFTTRGMDILLVLIRHLMSFGWVLDTRAKGHDVEATLVEIAKKDLGWRQEEDSNLKYRLFNKLHRQSIKDNRRLGYTFNDLLLRPELEDVFEYNMQFRLINWDVVQRGTKCWKLISDSMDEGELVIKNRLEFDSSQALALSLSEYFDPDPAGIQLTTRRPKFLQVRYRVLAASSGRGIAGLRVLDFEAPEARVVNGKLLLGIQKAIYHLCAIVRLTENKEERIRLYTREGSELAPGEIGDYRIKEPEAMEEVQWTIKEEGVYELFYFRLDIPKDMGKWPASEMKVDSDEYVTRDWVGRTE